MVVSHCSKSYRAKGVPKHLPFVVTTVFRGLTTVSKRYLAFDYTRIAQFSNDFGMRKLDLKFQKGRGIQCIDYLVVELGTGVSVATPNPVISGPCPPVLLTNHVDEDGLNTAASVFPSPS